MQEQTSAKIAVAPRKQILTGPWLDWAVVATSAWMVIGLYLDGWAHIHIVTMETFFTPWHAVLYSGFFAGALVLIATRLNNGALPKGYELALVGVLIFAFGGVADMFWHILFGIEVDVEALLSPTHLFLALGGTLIVTAPLRAAWGRDVNDRSLILPALLSISILFSMLTFFTQYANPLAETIAGMSHRAANSREAFHFEALGIASILFQSGLMMGLLLLIIRRWTLPFGSIILIFSANAILMASMNDKFLSTGPFPLIMAAALAGLIGDFLLNSVAIRVFAFALPAIFYGLYFLTLLLVGGGIWWSIHLWAGAIVLAGIVGWLMSYVAVPPLANK